jgi:hypothetical protein
VSPLHTRCPVQIPAKATAAAHSRTAYVIVCRVRVAPDNGQIFIFTYRLRRIIGPQPCCPPGPGGAGVTPSGVRARNLQPVTTVATARQNSHVNGGSKIAATVRQNSHVNRGSKIVATARQNSHVNGGSKIVATVRQNSHVNRGSKIVATARQNSRVNGGSKTVATAKQNSHVSGGSKTLIQTE